MHTSCSPKRLAILTAARQAFISNGYSGTSMEAIAEAAPVSKPTLYCHFKSKQELFVAVIAERCETLLTSVADAQNLQLDAVAGLKSIISAFVEQIYAPEALALYRLIVSELQQFPELGELFYRTGPERVYQQLASYLTELDNRQALKIADVNTATHLLLGMLKSDAHFRCLLGLQPGLSNAEKEHLINSALQLFLAGYGYEN